MAKFIAKFIAKFVPPQNKFVLQNKFSSFRLFSPFIKFNSINRRVLLVNKSDHYDSLLVDSLAYFLGERKISF